MNIIKKNLFFQINFRMVVLGDYPVPPGRVILITGGTKVWFFTHYTVGKQML